MKQIATITTFKNYQAYPKLEALAKHPYDLTKEGNLTPQRLKEMSAEGCGFKLLYGTERVTPEVMRELDNLAKEAHAIDKMREMQAGAVINLIEGFPSENRAVLHTAMRDLFDDQPIPDGAKHAVELAKKENAKLKAFAEKVKDRFTDLITIGMGGSDLGPKAVYMALQAYQKNGLRVHTIGNIDPDDAAMALKGVDLSKAVVIVISKSGTTLETVTNEAFVRQIFEKANLKPKEHFIAVTGEGSPMDDRQRYLESFYMWDFIGGRYSTTSMAGAVLLTLTLGYDVFLEFMKGAHEMDKAALNRDLNKNLPLLAALLGIWNRNFLHHSTVAIIPYSQALSRFSAHIQQVDMESNGKHIDRQGHSVAFDTSPIIWGEPGTCAQHSFYQMLHQGTTIVPMDFIGFKESQCGQDITVQGTTGQQKLLANLFAQAIGLATGKKSDNPNKEFLGNRPSRLLLANRLTPFSMGALFALYEHKAAFQGFIWGINSFDQEGVQLGKVLAEKIIDLYAKKGDNYPLGDALIQQLNTIA